MSKHERYPGQRSERRRQDLAQRRLQKRGSHSSTFLENVMSRKTIIKVAGLGITSALGFGTYDLATNQPIALREPEQPATPEQIINAEITRRRIKPDPYEQTFWPKAFHRDPNHTVLPSTEAYTLAEQRLLQTLNFMKSSHNPYFRDAESLINTLSQKKNLQFTFIASMSNPAEEGLATSPQNKNGKYTLVMEIPTDFVDSDTNQFAFAGTITHETLHMRRRLAYQAKLPKDFSIDQRIQYDRNFITNQRALMSEEAAAYGLQAQAYITECGLLGRQYAEQASGEKYRAAKYIQTGSNETDPVWISYITKILNGLN